jgi:hypothetical protein
MGERMLYDKLFEIAVGGWHFIAIEYKAWAVGAFVIAAVLIWDGIQIRKRMRSIEIQLQKMQNEINVLQVHNSRHFLTELNAKSKVEIGPHAFEMGNGDVARLTMSHPIMPAASEMGNAAKFAGSHEPLLRQTPSGLEEI